MTEEQRLIFKLIDLTKRTTLKQILNSRVNRDWEDYDDLTKVEQLRQQVEELQTINN